MSLQDLTSKSPTIARPRISAPGWLLPVGLLFGFLIIFLLAFRERLLPAQHVTTAPVVAVRANEQAASVAPSELLFQASGWIEPAPYPIMVPTLVNGIVDELHVLEGQEVKEGQLLAKLNDQDARLELEKVEREIATMRARIAAHCSQVPKLNAQLASAKAKVIAEKARLAELQDLANRLTSLPEGAASSSEIATALLRVDRQKAMLQEAEAEIPKIEAELATVDYERITMGNQFSELENRRDQAQLNLERHTITSPTNGTILHLHVSPGSKRMLNMDDPKSAVIVELFKVDELQARIDVPLNEAARLSLGQPVKLTTDLLSGTEFEGEVTRITGEADLQRNTLQAKVSIKNPDSRLRPEMLVRAKFYPLQNEQFKGPQTISGGQLVLFVPEEALVEPSATKASAWVINTESLAERRSLELGPAVREGHRQVVSGIRPGETVILPPHNNIEQGTRVKTDS